MSTDFLRTLESAAGGALEQLADLVAGKASTLRDGTEHAPVELPRDLYAHKDAQTEWWYYTGHMHTRAGRRFGFELVFFKRRTDLDRFGVVPLRLLANPIHLAHFAVTDESRGVFRYAHRKSANGPFDAPALASTKRYYLRHGDWSAREAHGVHLLRASLGGDLILEAELKPAKAPVLNGQGRIGVSFKDHGEASRYLSYTRMLAEGQITWRGATEACAGEAWMDREFGTWQTTDNQKGWDWFSLQLSDNSELMVYHIRDRDGRPSAFSSGTYVEPSGAWRHLAREDFEVEPVGSWVSPRTRARYPSGWRLRVPRLRLEAEVTPVLKDQELDTRGTTMVVYWEGACMVSGRRGDADVSGRAYAELVGYERSHERPSLASFLLGGSLDERLRAVFG